MGLGASNLGGARVVLLKTKARTTMVLGNMYTLLGQDGGRGASGLKPKDLHGHP